MKINGFTYGYIYMYVYKEVTYMKTYATYLYICSSYNLLVSAIVYFTFNIEQVRLFQLCIH